MKCYFGMVRCCDCNYFLSQSIRDFKETLLNYEVGSQYFFHHPDNDDFELHTIDRIIVLPTPSGAAHPFAVILISNDFERQNSDIVDNIVCNGCSSKKFNMHDFLRGFGEEL